MGSITAFSLFILGILVSISLPGIKAKSCPKDWLEYGGNCYEYFDTATTWAEAEFACQNYGPGTHLASILSTTEANVLAQYISSNQSTLKHVWIGLRDVRKNRRWKWSDSSLFSYKPWNADQPDNYGGVEYCVTLVAWTDFKKWNDARCSQRNAYICKQQL